MSFQEAPSLRAFVARFELGPVAPPPVPEPRRHLHLGVHLPAETAQKEPVPEEAVAPPPPRPVHLNRHQSPSDVVSNATIAVAVGDPTMSPASTSSFR